MTTILRALCRAVVIVVVAASVCGPAAVAGGASRPTLITGQSAYGRILLDGRRFALYAFTHDPKGRSTCSGRCASVWPPYVVPGSVAVAAGARSTLIGTTRRPDGTRQVTYGGRPLYYYVGDREPGQVLCQNVTEFGGVWRVVRASGALLR
jgi:predicted lipoprotein with Yx(FWY)xxD motif